MIKKMSALLLSILCACSLTACGSNPELTKFKNEMDSFCTSISEIDSAINSVDPDSEDAVEEVLLLLDKLEDEFGKFAEFDFPEEYDYLEELADESSEYMAEAVEHYHEAYSNNSYNEYLAEYAQENYSRAYKRVQIIITFLHGEEPTDADLTTS